MYYVYVLLSEKDKQFYIGFTPDDPFTRAEKHSNGLAPATKNRLPINLIYFEGHKNEQDALRRERYFKTTKGKVTLKQILKDHLKNIK